ncbi:LpqB family beta-propeller domain-containing protein [Gleimia sp. 6138-11-ORH1]|uniref:LpqB family beta-propeller domain-containing protein n=1 Tax=Gleimia sp. 6138-11-ORH1 TaxID=2973937 RepID=UPI00216A8821|nr:LpqB family beta-propeller domain-containing protein [Gleimia sp. 6138-11-ORH1]MCS4484056.1 LpqB family beta-propeller domain-containing protein [Gleimia sp. 6138-11-ORH1]
MGKKLTTILTLGLVCSLSACQNLPTSGPVTAFELQENDANSLVLKGFGPVKDAEADTIVRDFLRATAAGWSDDFQVARSYLTQEARRSWKPATSVYVYSDDYPPVISYDGESKITAATRVEASVSKDGLYQIEKTNSVYKSEFVLERDGQNQWRIASLPDGAVISESSFRAAFQRSAVFFPATDRRTLVADYRWFPRRRLASYLMQAILAGPSESVAPAVINAAPEGAVLPLQNVEVRDSVAEVEVEGYGLGTESSQLLFKWQVNATLLQVSNVSDVRIRINGVLISDQPVPTGPAWALDTLISLSKEGIIRDRDGKREVVLSTTDLGDEPVSYPTRGPLEDSAVAYIQGGSKILVVGKNTQPKEIYEGEKISSLSIDRANWVWTVSKGKIIVVRAGAEPILFDSPFGAEEEITAVRVSPDGARLLVIRGGQNPTVGVLPIRRNVDARPSGIGNVELLPTGDARTLDATWAGNETVAVLQAEAESRYVLISQLGANSERVRAPERVQRISGGASSQFLLLETEDGKYYTRTGSLWNALATTSDIRFRAFPH